MHPWGGTMYTVQYSVLHAVAFQNFGKGRKMKELLLYRDESCFWCGSIILQPSFGS